MEKKHTQHGKPPEGSAVEGQHLAPFTFFQGHWQYSERTVREWFEIPNPEVKTPPFEKSQIFLPSTRGTAVFRQILHGSYLYGEYKPTSQGNMPILAILLSRCFPSKDSCEMTLSVSRAKRFCGIPKTDGGRIYVDGKDIPYFFEGNILNNIQNSSAGNNSMEAVQNAGFVFHPLGPDLFLLLFYHFLNNKINQTDLIRTEIFHYRVGDTNPSQTHFVSSPSNKAFDRSFDDLQQKSEKPPLTLQPPDMMKRLAELEKELEEKRLEKEDLESDLEDVKDDYDENLNKIANLDFIFFGWNITWPLAESDYEQGGNDNKMENHYSSLVDLKNQISELECDIEDIPFEIDDLEDEIEELEWTETEYQEAEAIIQKTSATPSFSEKQLHSKEFSSFLSQDARKFIRTYSLLEDRYANDPEFKAHDCGPLVGAMAKVLERILFDFLEPQFKLICVDQGILSLWKDLKNMKIPAVDERFKIDKHSLERVLGRIGKSGQCFMNGTRNGAIALLLFGRTYRVGDEQNKEINNPLKLYGKENARQECRLDLYLFQELRNGYIHHDFAEWEHVHKIKECFKRCLVKLAYILFGVD